MAKAIINLVLIFFCLTSGILICNCENIPSDSKEDKGTEIIQDTLFKGGFSLTPTTPKMMQAGGYTDTLDFNYDGDYPVWQLAQWWSKYDLVNSLPVEGEQNEIIYTNEGNSKTIALFPDHSILLEVNASKEYDSARVQGQKWPHLLIAQNFNEQSPTLGQAEKLNFSMELMLVKAENKMEEGTYNTSMHTAQTPFFFIMKNENESSSDYGQKIWFGIRSYDYRYEELSTEEKISWDIGTSTFIYTIPTVKMWGDVNLHDKQWHKGKADLKPLMLRALEAMKEKGVFNNTSPDDIKITGMNFGWEVPGTFDAAIRVKNIHLKYYN